MSDYLQRLLQRSQPTPLRRLSAPVVPAMPALRGEGDSVVDPFAAAAASDLDDRATPAADATLATQEPARFLVAARPTPGVLVLDSVAPQATAEPESYFPKPASQADRSPAAKPPVPALSPTLGHPQPAAGSPAVHDRGRRIQPSIEHEQTAASSPPQPPHVAAVIGAEGGEVVQEEVAKTIRQPALPEPALAKTDFSADLQTLLRRLQGSSEPENEAPDAGDSQLREIVSAASAPAQALTPTAVPASPTGERRQLSIGRLIVEVTPAVPPLPAAPARSAPRPQPAPQPQTGVTSKLRFGIGQL